MAARTAKLRELVYPFVQWCKEKKIEPTESEFQKFVENSKNANYKLAVQIESIFGTAIWMHHAGVRANYPKITTAASNVFSNLFHVNNNPNYSKITIYDKHLTTTSKNVPEVFENLIKNEGINITNLPFAAQPHDAHNEEFNKKGQNIFKGEEVEDFSLAFAIVDDLYAMRSQMFAYANVQDRMDNPQAKVPNYEPLIKLIRTGIRKSEYFLYPMEDKKELTSMTGSALNPKLSSIFRSAVSARNSDIRNVIRYNDLSKSFSNKNRISILKSEINCEKSPETFVKELKTEIKIMIEIIDDAEIQIQMRSMLKENQTKGKDFLEKMLDGLTSKNYGFYD